MEKIKNFVIKYQLWIKLVAIALLVCVIFTPYIYVKSKALGLTVVGKETFWNLIKYNDNALKYPANYRFHFTSSWFIFFITLFAICSIITSFFIKTKKIILISTFLNIINFPLILATTLHTVWFGKNTASNDVQILNIPHIAFFFAFILFGLSIIILPYLIKQIKLEYTNKPHILSKNEKISELEKRIKQLEERIKQLEERDEK